MTLFHEIEKEKKITAKIINEGLNQYGNLFLRSLNFIKQSGPKIKKHVFNPSKLIIWSVQGSEREYLLYPKIYCQCQSFQIETIYRNKKYKPCKHLLAYEIANSLDQIKEEYHSDEEWVKFKNSFN